MIQKSKTLDFIQKQIPGNILENYPRFVDFLLAYYEWLTKEDNPYNVVKYHLNRLAFEESIDTYINLMKNEYLSDMPEEVISDKELFIRWSKKFNLARGSHASYKLLFNMLYDDDKMEIYLPKDNILKTSDGTWIANESKIQITYKPTNLEDFQFKRIFQEIPIYGDIIKYVSADVETVRTKYVGSYILTELSISNIEGEFDPDYPIFTDLGVEEYLVPTIVRFEINDGGQYYQVGQRLEIENVDFYYINRTATENGIFDTRTTSFFNKTDLILKVNDVIIDESEFSFDGRNIVYQNISIGDDIKVDIPAYQGYIIVDRVDENGGVLEIDVLDLPVGCACGSSLAPTTIGENLDAIIRKGYVKKVKGYFKDTRGHLSSNMYLQDSFYYQNYSYVIKTSVDFDKYGDVVKQVLHPAGFLMIGQMSIINIIELILKYYEVTIEIPPLKLDEIIHKYGLGPNYQFVNKLGKRSSIRLYNKYHIDKKDYRFVNGENGYNLESMYLLDRVFEKPRFKEIDPTLPYDGFFEEDYIDSNYIFDTAFDYEYPYLRGWMHKDNWVDYFNYIEQEYTHETESGIQYFETGYVVETL